MAELADDTTFVSTDDAIACVNLYNSKNHPPCGLHQWKIFTNLQFSEKIIQVVSSNISLSLKFPTFSNLKLLKYSVVPRF